jgi:hypothetical protein
MPQGGNTEEGKGRMSVGATKTAKKASAALCFL